MVTNFNALDLSPLGNGKSICALATKIFPILSGKQWTDETLVSTRCLWYWSIHPKRRSLRLGDRFLEEPSKASELVDHPTSVAN
nr:AlNc14C168G7939 [Albugo laibachii Nc14]|eukprot:CCA22797.1 AlNc14C168G7939 [Albugo laibachii Nc14]